MHSTQNSSISNNNIMIVDAAAMFLPDFGVSSFSLTFTETDATGTKGDVLSFMMAMITPVPKLLSPGFPITMSIFPCGTDEALSLCLSNRHS